MMTLQARLHRQIALRSPRAKRHGRRAWGFTVAAGHRPEQPTLQRYVFTLAGALAWPWLSWDDLWQDAGGRWVHRAWALGS